MHQLISKLADLQDSLKVTKHTKAAQTVQLTHQLQNLAADSPNALLVRSQVD